jgi:hypothetical protein
MNNEQQEFTLAEIEQRYPQQWVLVEETAWNKHGDPLRGIVRAHGVHRSAVSSLLQKLHRKGSVKTFVFYTGTVIPENVIVVL